MATIAQIKAGLKANLDLVFTDPWTVTAYIPTSPNPPSIDVAPAHPVAIEYDKAMRRGGDCLYFIVRAVAPVSIDSEWQTLLDGLMDPTSATSMKAAVEKKDDANLSQATLGGIVSWVRVIKASGYHPYVIEGSASRLMGVEWTVEVQT